jgi:predicted phage-related endonuclease
MNSLSLSPMSRALNARAEGVEIVPVTDRASWLAMREQDVTASVAGALLGVHPYQTAFGLHLIKTGQAVDEVDSEPEFREDRIVFPPAARGNSFEPIVIQHVRMLRPTWTIDYPLARYWRLPAARIGCTPDALVADPARPGFGCVQIKTTSDFLFKKTWTDPDTGDVTIPLWVAIQAMVEAKVTGASWAVVAVMMTGLRTETVLIDIPLHDGLWQKFQGEVALFWQRIDAGTPPDPDYNRDGDLIRRLFAVSDGTVLDIEGDKAAAIAEIIASREKLKVTEKAGSEAARERREIDDRIIFALGNAEAGRLPDGTLITARTTNRKTYTVHASSYRTVAVSQKGTTA